MSRVSTFVLAGVKPAEIAERYESGGYRLMKLPEGLKPVETGVSPTWKGERREDRTLEYKSGRYGGKMGTTGHMTPYCLYCRRPCPEVPDPGAPAGIPLSFTPNRKIPTFGRVDTWGCIYNICWDETLTKDMGASVSLQGAMDAARLLFRKSHPKKAFKAAPSWLCLERNGGWLTDKEYGETTTAIRPIPGYKFEPVHIRHLLVNRRPTCIMPGYVTEEYAAGEKK